MSQLCQNSFEYLFHINDAKYRSQRIRPPSNQHFQEVVSNATQQFFPFIKTKNGNTGRQQTPHATGIWRRLVRILLQRITGIPAPYLKFNFALRLSTLPRGLALLPLTSNVLAAEPPLQVGSSPHLQHGSHVCHLFIERTLRFPVGQTGELVFLWVK